MSEFFRTIHSVLDSEAIARACAEQYGFAEQPNCEFIHRGMNDVYLLRTKEQRYAVRAWRAHWRSMDDVAYELEFLQFLKNEGLPVVPGLRCKSVVITLWLMHRRGRGRSRRLNGCRVRNLPSSSMLIWPLG